jgi:hypothetical protein
LSLIFLNFVQFFNNLKLMAYNLLQMSSKLST